MLENLRGLKSYKVFEYFKEMNTIPRGSGNEKAVSDWLVNFAKKYNLEVMQDKYLNVIIKKPGSKGYENSPTVVLQGHMDMVCEKNGDKVHDFTKDPIGFIVEGDILRADGTTLGADNGIAVAFGLAVLSSNYIAHPPIELLVTTEEETGMGGAEGLDPKNISGKMLINIDSEEEGKLLVSCAGGVREVIKLPIQFEQSKEENTDYAIRVRGLMGGHSGMEIDKERGNANKLLGRFLNDLKDDVDFNLVSINGGSKMNAITREADAILSICKGKIAKVEEKISQWNRIFKVELNAQDPNVTLIGEALNTKALKVFSKESGQKAIKLLVIIPNGVQTMSIAIKGLVESSTNIGVVATTDSHVLYESAVRSSVKTLKDEISKRGEIIAELLGAEITFESDYPAWQYNPESKLREKFISVYKEKFGNEPEISAIHAGLECGLFGGKFGADMDMISFGPNIYDVHSPKEHLSISSTDRTFGYLLEVLKSLK